MFESSFSHRGTESTEKKQKRKKKLCAFVPPWQILPGLRLRLASLFD